MKNTMKTIILRRYASQIEPVVGTSELRNLLLGKLELVLSPIFPSEEMISAEVRDSPIDYGSFSASPNVVSRIKKAFSARGITTYGLLLMQEEEDFFRMKGFGELCLQAVMRHLREKGIKRDY